MNALTLKRVDELFARFPTLLGGPASRDEIDAAERRIGVPLSADYREFLGRYGGAVVGSLPILGLRKAEVMSDVGYSVTDVTMFFRADGWVPSDKWAIVSIDLAGNPIGLTSAGEVWISDHDAGETILVAPTFEQFVLGLLDETQ
jgi:hypothetical protein